MKKIKCPTCRNRIHKNWERCPYCNRWNDFCREATGGNIEAREAMRRIYLKAMKVKP